MGVASKRVSWWEEELDLELVTHSVSWHRYLHRSTPIEAFLPVEPRLCPANPFCPASHSAVSRVGRSGSSCGRCFALGADVQDKTINNKSVQKLVLSDALALQCTVCILKQSESYSSPKVSR